MIWDYTNPAEINKELYNYFDTFDYILYKGIDNKNINSFRILNNKENIGVVEEKKEYEKLVSNYQKNKNKNSKEDLNMENIMG